MNHIAMLRTILFRRSICFNNRNPGSNGLSCIRALTSDAETKGNDQGNEQDSDPEQAGRSLAKLSRMAQTLRRAIEHQARYDLQHPELLVSLEQEVDEAYDLIRQALDRAGRPCTIEELGDRINKNVVAVPVKALGYRELMRADLLRDQIERTLVSLEEMPPQEAAIDGSDKPFGRPNKKEKQKMQQSKVDEVLNNQDEVSEEAVVLKELYPVSPEDLRKRKAYMEDAIKIENVLAGYDTALLEVGRVHKVTKGGTTFSLRALVVMGNRNGTAGYGEGKSDNQLHAIERACRDAKRNLLNIKLHDDRTIYHRIQGKFVKSKVSLWPAPRGTGISANNNFSAVLQLFGLKDVGAKLHGPRSLTNAVKALFNALSKLQTPEDVRQVRGLATLSRSMPLRNDGRRPRLRAL